MHVGPPQRRAVLAALLVDVGHPVPADALLERVWDRPPASARRALHAHIARLRHVLALGSQPVALVRRSGGYALEAVPDRVDLHRFRSLASAGRHQRGDGAARLLRQALALWRGSPLADVTGDWAARLRDGLLRQRLDVGVQLAEAQLRLGSYSAVIELARELLVDYPLSEALCGALMRALAATGRPAEALACYGTLRTRLRTELGADPESRLQQLHLAILENQAPPTAARDEVSPSIDAPPVPVRPLRPAVGPAITSRYLPRDVADFVGREAALRRLRQTLPAPGTAGPSVVLVVDGMPGVGKTALAVRLANLVADQYPDGALHVDLHGHSDDAPPLAPAAGMAVLLGQLGVAGERIPESPQGRTMRWRDKLAGRRLVLLLDNAATSQQVAPLLPAGEGCLALVTSRRRLAGLDGARPLSLDVLTPSEATALLHSIIGERAAADPPGTAEVARVCGYLALAIRLAATRLAHRPTWTVADLLMRLRAARSVLAELSVDGRSLTGAFSLSYQSLPGPQQRMFRLLGLHTGETFDLRAAAAVAELRLEEAGATLDGLLDAHLVQEPAAGRYRLHGLLREYSRGLPGAVVPGRERPAVAGRRLDGYLSGMRYGSAEAV